MAEGWAVSQGLEVGIVAEVGGGEAGIESPSEDLQSPGGQGRVGARFCEEGERAGRIVETVGRGRSKEAVDVGDGERIAQTTTGAATTLGSAAGMALSAPVALVDGKTRDELGDEFEEMQNHISAVGRPGLSPHY